MAVLDSLDPLWTAITFLMLGVFLTFGEILIPGFFIAVPGGTLMFMGAIGIFFPGAAIVTRLIATSTHAAPPEVEHQPVVSEIDETADDCPATVFILRRRGQNRPATSLRQRCFLGGSRRRPGLRGRAQEYDETEGKRELHKELSPVE